MASSHENSPPSLWQRIVLWAMLSRKRPTRTLLAILMAASLTWRGELQHSKAATAARHR